MSTGTSIEWTDTTWNPVVGCTPVSTGCLNCYAATFAARGLHQSYVGLTVRRKDKLRDGEKAKTRAVFNGTVRTLPEKLTEPLRWRKPRRVFVNSMSDLFHEAVPFEFVDRVFAVMALCPQHTFQVLTKRPERMAEYLNNWPAGMSRGHHIAYQLDQHGRALVSEPRKQYDGSGPTVQLPLPNVWLGTSVENQAAADERIPHLLRCPAAVRFLSVEPLLGPVDLGQWLRTPEWRRLRAEHWKEPPVPEPGWVIVGGESGPGARPCNVEWIRSVVGQCKAAGVPVFVKQLGKYPMLSLREDVEGEHPTVEGAPSSRRAWERGEFGERLRLADSKGGTPDEWPADLRVREMPGVSR